MLGLAPHAPEILLYVLQAVGVCEDGDNVLFETLNRCTTTKKDMLDVIEDKHGNYKGIRSEISEHTRKDTIIKRKQTAENPIISQEYQFVSVSYMR